MEGKVSGLGWSPPSHFKLLQHMVSSIFQEEDVVMSNAWTPEEKREEECL